MPTRVWLFIFALAIAVISLATAMAGVLGSTAWVVALAGIIFVLSVVAAIVGYRYMRNSDRETALTKAENDASKRTERWLVSRTVPPAS
jgi:membrane protein implicated in regulation of membrane protease activity